MTKKSLFKLIVCVMITLCLSIGQAYSFTENNGVFNVLVVIDESEPESASLITTIETEMKAASKYLYNATKEQHQFGEITILIPEKWSNKPEYKDVTNQNASNFDIKVANNIDGAFASGNKIYINPDLMHGQGRVVVHEWGHAVYNLGDEYCDYMTDSTTGTTYQKFKIGNKWCKCTAKTDFETDVEDNSADGNYDVTIADANGEKASIMWYQWASEIVEFCGSNNHNTTVQTHHNRIHSNKSCYEVMDGQYGFSMNPSAEQTRAYSDPTIEKVKNSNKMKVALVVDSSGSMGSGTGSPLEIAKSAAQKFVDTMVDNDYVGAVQFSDFSTIVKALTQLVDQAARNEVISAIGGITGGGSTSIGAGLQNGQTVLEQNTDTGYKLICVLLTDGRENTAPYIADVQPALVSAGIAVYAIGLGDVDSSTLRALANATGGKYKYISDAGQIVQVFNDIQADINSSTTVMLSVSSVAPVGGNITEQVVVDQSITQNLIFSFSASDTTDLIFTVESPSGSIYDNAYAGYVSGEGYAIFKITDSDIEPGIWTMKAENTGATDMDVIFSSNGNSRIRALASVKHPNVTAPDPIHILGTVTSDGVPIRNLEAYAEVTTPGGNMTTVWLNDNGINGDTIPLDGSYEGYFYDFDQNGDYSIVVYFTNENGDAIIGVGFPDGSSDGVERKTPKSGRTISYNFIRQTQSDACTVTGYTGQQIAPGTIKTLTVLSTNTDDDEMTLQWAAPGNEGFTGTCASYDIRYANEVITEANFSQAEQIENAPTPAEAGTYQRFTVQVSRNDQDETEKQDGNDTTYYFAMKATGSTGVESALSNNAIAAFSSASGGGGGGDGGDGGCFLGSILK